MRGAGQGGVQGGRRRTRDWVCPGADSSALWLQGHIWVFCETSLHSGSTFQKLKVLDRTVVGPEQ